MIWKSVLALLLCGSCVAGMCQEMASTTSPLSAPVSKLPPPARPGLKTAKPERFLQLHQDFLKRGKSGPIDLLFLGDSITEQWATAPDVWEKYYGHRNAANFGIGGDRTQHVLWRLLNGELEGISPKVVVVMIGTNNSKTDAPEDIALGIERIVETIREKLPDSKVLLLGIFPRGLREKEGPAPPQVVQDVNRIISKLHDGNMIHYLDLRDKLLVDGKVTADVLPDQVHLSKKGYDIWAKSMEPTLRELLGETAP